MTVQKLRRRLGEAQGQGQAVEVLTAPGLRVMGVPVAWRGCRESIGLRPTSDAQSTVYVRIDDITYFHALVRKSWLRIGGR